MLHGVVWVGASLQAAFNICFFLRSRLFFWRSILEFERAAAYFAI